MLGDKNFRDDKGYVIITDNICVGVNYVAFCIFMDSKISGDATIPDNKYKCMFCGKIISDEDYSMSNYDQVQDSRNIIRSSINKTV